MKSILSFIVVCIVLSACQTTGNQPVSKNTIMKDTQRAVSMSCKLTTSELQKRKEEAIAYLKKQVREKKELPDGYRYTFTGTDEMLETITAFIKSERDCCGFFNFTMTVTNDLLVSLDITGAEGVKEFIRMELEM
jgi:hypothetical protein